MALDYPTRPIRLIVGFPPGGTTDIVARTIAQLLSAQLGQPIVVDNRPGGATNLAVQAALGAPPDGYTLLFSSSSNAINATFYYKLPFNLLRDLAPIAVFYGGTSVGAGQDGCRIYADDLSYPLSSATLGQFLTIVEISGWRRATYRENFQTGASHACIVGYRIDLLVALT
jgi:hypothetical protein